MKKIFFILIFTIIIFPIIGNAKVITKADLEAEAEALKEEANKDNSILGIDNITVGDSTIVFDLSDNSHYSVEYEIGEENTTFKTETYVNNGMSSEEFDEASVITIGHLLVHMMLCHFNGVSYDDAFTYFLSMGKDSITFDENTRSYMIVADDVEATASDNTMIIKESEFGDHVTELAEWLYKNKTDSDVNNIYSCIYDVETSEGRSTITLRLVYKNDADFSPMIGESDRVKESIDNEFSDMFNFDDEKKTNPKTGTTVDVPNTALSVDKKIYMVGVMLILSGILLIDKVIKRKSN
ncbi:MAG: hypothetical protein IJI43_00575 [Bacilli bacterium]|nr:hypothetical protein [Bacilli bacterium]